jgi:hypothetical protein
MRRRGALALGLLAALWAGGGAAAADLHAQLAELLRWLPGTYDNAAQVARQGGGGPFYPVRTIVRPVTMPGIAAHVLYLEEYRDNDPAKLTRVRLYTFAIDAAAGAIRLHLVNPLRPEALIGAHADLARVEALTLADMRVDRPVCDVLIRKDGAVYRGTMTPRTCNRPDGTWVDYTLIVGPDRHWVRNRARSASDDAVAWEFVPGAGEGFIEQFKLP